MYGQIRLVDSVLDFAPSRNKWLTQPIEALTGKVTVTFKTGEKGTLDMKSPRTVHWARRIARATQSNQPVYVEIDQETGVITNVRIPQVYKVKRLDPDGHGNYRVQLQTSPILYFLLESNPFFESMRDSLQTAIIDDSERLITDTRNDHEIIDVREPENRPPEPPGPGSPPIPDDPVSEARAVEIFNDMQARSCDPCDPSIGMDGSECITFLYPDNGCQVRAHIMCHLMMAGGPDLSTNPPENPDKVWVHLPCLPVFAPNNPYCHVDWCWHVAPTLMVSFPGGDEKRVIDPSLFDAPVSITEWKNRQNTGGSICEGVWTDYYDCEDGLGASISLQDAYDSMQYYRDELLDTCQHYGPPPYNCTKNCFFIIDRSTFSTVEIQAMLDDQGNNPVSIEAAFYIVADGFSPDELGFTAPTMQVTPDLDITPGLSQIDIEPPVRVEFEYETNLYRPQRITWVYNVIFRGVDDFTSEQVTVRLDASVSTEACTGYLYLIQQPNPYETDGEISWLSTDLRVFQICEGEDKFGEHMGADPCTFISNVINRLNTHNTGGQTFEDHISLDQQTSHLELSQVIDSTPVYNFAIAKVRYRSHALPATDVRVFFRLFPWATTSLEYDRDTTYKRFESGGKILPLLGIVGNEVRVIPFFATPRYDTTVHKISDQPEDLPNKQTIPANMPGEDVEVVRYFGCWLDINRLTPRFPLYTTESDGPFPSGSASIYDHVRGEHQCLVSEIVFSPAPAQDGATPSVSDKLAQRNLNIVPAANPGIVFSRRIPQTFEIQPSKSRLENDELMIDWGNLPEGSVATLYLPGLNTDDVLLLAARKYRSHRLARIDEHTLKSDAGGITYLPIPFTDAGIQCLLTIDLPEGIKKGQAFTVVVRQVTGEQQRIPMAAYYPGTHLSNVRHITGSFQITIPVRDKAEILPKQQRLLSNLRWIERAIPANDRWAPVFGKYVAQIASRVDALGGDSSQVAPSPSGQWREAYRLCLFLALVAILLIIAVVVCLGVIPGGLAASVAAIILVLLMVTIYYWRRKCRPKVCQILQALLAGVGIGAIVLAVLALAGVSTPLLIPTLLGSAAAAGLVAIWNWRRGCFGK
jgi:hypothetical protein